MKKGGHISDRDRQGASFSFYSFFSISVRKSPKMAKMCKKGLKINFFAQNMQLKTISNKIKLFCHILKGHMQVFHFFVSVRKSSKLAKAGPKWLKSPKKRSEFHIFYWALCYFFLIFEALPDQKLKIGGHI